MRVHITTYAHVPPEKVRRIKSLLGIQDVTVASWEEREAVIAEGSFEMVCIVDDAPGSADSAESRQALSKVHRLLKEWSGIRSILVRRRKELQPVRPVRPRQDRYRPIGRNRRTYLYG